MSAPGILAARLLGDHPHGFTTREGGSLAGPLRDPEPLHHGGRRPGAGPGELGAAAAPPPGSTSPGSARSTGAAWSRPPPGPMPVEEADAVATATPGVAACVSVADCVPVLLADPRSGAVAAVHAGWRGTIDGAAAAGVRALVDAARRPPVRAARGHRPGDRSLLLRGLPGPGGAIPGRGRSGDRNLAGSGLPGRPLAGQRAPPPEGRAGPAAHRDPGPVHLV